MRNRTSPRIPERDLTRLQLDADHIWVRETKKMHSMFAKGAEGAVAKGENNQRLTKIMSLRARCRLLREEVTRFADRYFFAVSDASEHFVDLLTDAVAFRKGLGKDEIAWIENQAKEYALDKYSQSLI